MTDVALSGVPQGLQIGRVGDTGRGTGVHLDLEVEVNGERADPLELVDAASIEITRYAELLTGSVFGEPYSERFWSNLFEYDPNEYVDSLITNYIRSGFENLPQWTRDVRDLVIGGMQISIPYGLGE